MYYFSVNSDYYVESIPVRLYLCFLIVVVILVKMYLHRIATAVHIARIRRLAP